MGLNLNIAAVDSRTLGTHAAGGNSVSSQTGQASQRSEQAGQPVSQTLEQAVGSLQDFMTVTHRNLNFSVDESTGIQVVKVVASDTGEVIRQMPSEVALKLAQSLKDGNTSLFDGWA